MYRTAMSIWCHYYVILLQAKLEVRVETVFVCVLRKTISLNPRPGLHWVSFPDHPKKWKEGLVFWVTLTWRELLEKECCNCILQLRLQLSDYLDGWVTKLEKAVKSLWTVENKLWDKYTNLAQTACTIAYVMYNYTLCKLKSDLALCGKKVSPEHNSCTCKKRV